jgi:hypothetical protein
MHSACLQRPWPRWCKMNYASVWCELPWSSSTILDNQMFPELSLVQQWMPSIWSKGVFLLFCWLDIDVCVSMFQSPRSETYLFHCFLKIDIFNIRDFLVYCGPLWSLKGHKTKGTAEEELSLDYHLDCFQLVQSAENSSIIPLQRTVYGEGFLFVFLFILFYW